MHKTDAKHETIVFGFTFDWLRKWRIFVLFCFVFVLPTAEQSKAKPKQMQITFDDQLKTALFWTCFKRGKTCFRTGFLFFSIH